MKKIILCIRHIAFIFFVTFATFWSMCISAFFSCFMLSSEADTDLPTEHFIQTTRVDCSNSVNHNRVLVLGYSTHSLLVIYYQDWTCKFQEGCETRSILKRSFKGSNLVFYLQTGCRTKIKDPTLAYYFLVAGRRIVRLIPFSRVSTLCESISLVKGLISWHRVHFLWR